MILDGRVLSTGPGRTLAIQLHRLEFIVGKWRLPLSAGHEQHADQACENNERKVPPDETSSSKRHIWTTDRRQQFRDQGQGRDRHGSLRDL